MGEVQKTLRLRYGLSIVFLWRRSPPLGPDFCVRGSRFVIGGCICGKHTIFVCLWLRSPPLGAEFCARGSRFVIGGCFCCRHQFWQDSSTALVRPRACDYSIGVVTWLDSCVHSLILLFCMLHAI